MSDEQPIDGAADGPGGGLSARGVTVLSLVANASLSAAKIAAGVLFFSQTILADGLHSLSDLVTDVAVLAGLRASGKPADGDHHYGHGRVSTLVALFVGGFLLLAAGYIAYGAIDAIHAHLDGHADQPVRPLVPLLAAIVSIPAKEALFRITRAVGRRTQDRSLVANAWHHRSDAFSSVAAAAGLAGILVGGAGWWFLDPLTAIVLSTFIVVMAIRIMAGSAEELIDRAPEAATMAAIEDAVAGTRGVRTHHAVRARQVGGKVEMDVHVQVDGELSVREGHDIAKAVRKRIVEADPSVVQVIVHVEPAEAPRPEP